MHEHLIFYDGVCGFCNRIVKVVLKRDKKDKFLFAALQTDFAKAFLAEHGKDAADLDTMYLALDFDTPNERLLWKGRAALKIFKELGGPISGWSLLGFLPTAMLDWGYGVVANNRYKLFGKVDACPIPTREQMKKFLSTDPRKGGDLLAEHRTTTGQETGNSAPVSPKGISG